MIEHWSPGIRGAARMGVVHGLYCFGCCWGLMTILFIMGVMHLGWMAAIGAIILLEKLLPTRIWIVKASGAVFVLLGLLVLIRPSVLSALSSQVVLLQ
jgi:predicted metal-binding membrane protein